MLTCLMSTCLAALLLVRLSHCVQGAGVLHEEVPVVPPCSLSVCHTASRVRESYMKNCAALLLVHLSCCLAPCPPVTLTFSCIQGAGELREGVPVDAGAESTCQADLS
jgi:hypothetical protein